MKKKPAHHYQKSTGRMPIIATMADESMIRRNAWLKNGCNAFDAKSPKSQPMSFWTHQDILHYIKKNDIPICSVYGEIVIDQDSEFDGQMNLIDYLGDYEPEDTLKTTGCDRTGCIFCMFGCHLEKEPNRFQRLKETHPRQYEYCIGGGEMVDGKWQPNKQGLGLGHVLDYIGVDYK
jgi:3'-phosphoadenosine 5'-phosphosulfate sulfotransferase (PAPS reductase)/FAD synthetase